MTSDILMIAPKLFIVTLKRVVETLKCSAISRLCDTFNDYRKIEKYVVACERKQQKSFRGCIVKFQSEPESFNIIF